MYHDEYENRFSPVTPACKMIGFSIIANIRSYDLINYHVRVYDNWTILNILNVL